MSESVQSLDGTGQQAGRLSTRCLPSHSRTRTTASMVADHVMLWPCFRQAERTMPCSDHASGRPSSACRRSTLLLGQMTRARDSRPLSLLPPPPPAAAGEHQWAQVDRGGSGGSVAHMLHGSSRATVVYMAMPKGLSLKPLPNLAMSKGLSLKPLTNLAMPSSLLACPSRRRVPKRQGGSWLEWLLSMFDQYLTSACG